MSCFHPQEEDMHSTPRNLFHIFNFLGDVEETEREIVVEDVPIITPNGDVVVRALNLNVGIFI